jgi:hypothetical protein
MMAGMEGDPGKLDYAPPDQRPSPWVAVVVRLLIGFGAVAVVVAILWVAAFFYAMSHVTNL